MYVCVRVQVKALMLAGVLNPSHGFSVMCSTGAEILVVRSGLYTQWGQRKEKYGTGIELFRSSARQVFWLVHWNMNAKSGKEVIDVSNTDLSSILCLLTVCL